MTAAQYTYLIKSAHNAEQQHQKFYAALSARKLEILSAYHDMFEMLHKPDPKNLSH
jgi:hypothetical protein